MDQPNRSVFEKLKNLHLRLQERDPNGFAHDRVRILVRDYGAWRRSETKGQRPEKRSSLPPHQNETPGVALPGLHHWKEDPAQGDLSVQKG